MGVACRFGNAIDHRRCLWTINRVERTANAIGSADDAHAGPREDRDTPAKETSDAKHAVRGWLRARLGPIQSWHHQPVQCCKDYHACSDQTGHAPLFERRKEKKPRHHNNANYLGTWATTNTEHLN